MTIQSKIVAVVAVVAAMSLGAGCAGEDECSGSECANVERQRPSDGADEREPVYPCEVMCANLDECGFMAEPDCMDACAAQTFTPDEQDCLAVACGESIGICLEAGHHGDGGHRGQDGGRGDRE